MGGSLDDHHQLPASVLPAQPAPRHRVPSYQIQQKPQHRPSLAHSGSHVHPTANHSIQEDGWICSATPRSHPHPSVSGWGQPCPVHTMAQCEGGLVQREIRPWTGTRKSWMLVSFLSSEQENESERWDVPQPRSRCSSHPEKGFQPRLSCAVVPGGVASAYFSIHDPCEVPRRHWVVGGSLSLEPHPLIMRASLICTPQKHPVT